MVADTYTPNLGLIEQGTGNNNNTWGTTFNNAFALIADRAIAGVNTISFTGGTVDYSGSPPPAAARQDVDAIQIANGALVSDLTIIVPNLSKLWWFQNKTTGNFNMFVKTPSGTATQIPQSCSRFVMCDGNNNVIRGDKDEIGSIRISAKSQIGAGELSCSGQSLLKAEFPDLFSAIGTLWGSVDGLHFTLPNFTDTGRFLRAGGGASGLIPGSYQSSQNAAHTHTITGAPAVGSLTTDSQGSHTHSATPSDPGHVHTSLSNSAANSGNGPAFAGNSSSTGTTFSTASAVTNISVSIGSAGAHTHNVTGTLSAGTLGTASSGGSEARPESAVVLFGIRY